MSNKLLFNFLCMWLWFKTVYRLQIHENRAPGLYKTWKVGIFKLSISKGACHQFVTTIAKGMPSVNLMEPLQ